MLMVLFPLMGIEYIGLLFDLAFHPRAKISNAKKL